MSPATGHFDSYAAAGGSSNPVQDVFGGCVHLPGHISFVGTSRNPSPRMIRWNDRSRHGNKTNIGFLDGHVETRRLEGRDLPVKLFNPYDTTAYP